MVTEGSRLADVGTDHGYIPISLCERGVIPSAIAMDIRKGPLLCAQENIRRYGMEDRVQTRLSDGVKKLLPGEADSVVIAGMGGNVMRRILDEGRQILASVKELILQPQSEIGAVRQYLQANGYRIVSECMIFEDGKYYTAMKVEHGFMEPLSDIEWKYGRFLLEEKDQVLAGFLEKESSNLCKVLERLEASGTGKGQKRREEVAAFLRQNEKAKERIR